ncbi:hypothetical protein SS1G_13653 [Sclerotinia sclerotiorum 1980 UF-70]|uniref:Uncharacterized protein n=1 Tax=Sclerotinia sclerotiorum (strain ATCC 18683 / 1980 / Ss-1) TaxID=665079 RepID=A7F7S3_SCLS1|nr:hypothetical protein SS1G_13653 [Sclerotinia sclerotiorum 1980 UF-70]EDN98794.1 hypothetical protein SS1G_13653 [Sclerotinia sclerotiorum 1980 UF-70]
MSGSGSMSDVSPVGEVKWIVACCALLLSEGERGILRGGTSTPLGSDNSLGSLVLYEGCHAE